MRPRFISASGRKKTIVSNRRFQTRIASLLADDECIRIMTVTKEKPKSPHAIAEETSIPFSTLYRKISELKAAGLLTMDGFEIRLGKRIDYLRTAVSEVRMTTTQDGVSLDLIPANEPTRLKWAALFGDGTESPKLSAGLSHGANSGG